MKKELQCIALILFGILLCVCGLMSYNFGIAFAFLGLFIGGLGLASIFSKDKDNDNKK